MALTLTELQAMTDYYYTPGVYDIFFKGNVLLYKLMGGETGSKTIGGGKKIKVDLEYAAANSGSYGNTTLLPINKKEIFNSAFYGWSAYYSGVTVDLEDQRQNSGEAALVNLVQGKLKNAQKSIRTDMGTDIYASNASDATQFNGLADLFDTTTSTAYGEIKEDDMATWKANQTAKSEAISFKLLQLLRRTAALDDTDEAKPDLYITTDTLKDGFERTLQVQARYTDRALANAGFDNILFGGRPIVQDNKVTSTRIYALNTKFLDILTHKDFNFTKPVWNSPIQQPDTKVAFIRWSGQLVCKNRKAHCLFTGVTEPS
jgi:hypothetical protein